MAGAAAPRPCWVSGTRAPTLRVLAAHVGVWLRLTPTVMWHA